MIRKKDKNRIILFFIILLITILVLVFQVSIRSFFYTISEPVQQWLWQKGKNSSDFLDGLFSFSTLTKENQFLKEENKELLSKIVDLEDLRQENEELRIALDLGLADDYEFIETRVFSINLEQDFILVNKGKQDGVEKGMAIIDFHNVLIGRVEEVYANQSKVFLVSNNNIKFSIEIEGEKINGLAKGNGNGEMFLDLVPKEEELIRGALITTAGLEADFPQGLLVGRIGDIEKTDLAPFQKANIELLSDVRKQNNLLIILAQ
ncbi:rod shape-determining protein MreC [Patescibacteria group bacterium]|nr:rod shape-determining protein MreC [Patescibacteria group bacterium]MBU4022763.1 rod shape-determining protein MreC [Patescibacteria group bacterium]MBU4078397.1 rod shape-determining protein MreC [Patescibacteria group bacterium]